MKKYSKIITASVLALIVCAIAFGALAAYQGTMYVNKSKVNVYKEDNTDSKVIKTYNGGRSVFVDDVSPNGKWAQIMVEDTKHGGQMLGFIQMKYLSKEIPQEYCKHDWGKWKVTQEATCTEQGKRSRTCKICGKKETEKIKAKGHSWGKWKVTKEATCTKKGERTRKCSVCGKKETETFYAEHTYGAWAMTKEPTCTETGARERTCKVCGKVDTQTLNKLPHEYQWEVLVEPTDHSAGTRAKICVNCGHDGGEEDFDPEGTLRRGDRSEAVYHMQQLLVEQGYLNAGGADGIFGGGSEKALKQYQQDRNLNPDGIAWPQTMADLEHDYGPWEIVKPLTRTESGERMRVCRGCGFEQRETIDAGTMLTHGDRGESVRAMQQIIKEVGYDAGGYDGIYGKKLDAALAGFAADHGMVVEAGRIRPADVDAVVNAWFDVIPTDSWKGEGTLDTPVDLALTVESAGEADGSGILSYNWKLTNLGSQKATFTALLLTFGDEADFRRDDLVLALDGIVLKPNAGNSASGSFYVNVEWGEGNLNLAAMAVNEADGAKWLSNTVVFENDVSPAEKTVAPMTQTVDVNNLPDGAYPVSFNRGDVLSGASGTYMNAVHIYTQDWYDIVDVNTLKAGDTVIVSGEAVPVHTVEETEYGILVNDDQDDMESFYFRGEDEPNGFAIHGLDDMTTYTEQGVTTLVIDPAATFTDAWDIQSEPVTVSGADIAPTMQTSANEYFVQYNTTVRIEGGKVVEINRVYVP